VCADSGRNEPCSIHFRAECAGHSGHYLRSEISEPLAYNIFQAFIGLNLKRQLRDNRPETYWARLIAAELYSDAGTAPKRAP
jgi:hypothetical protein